MAFIAYILWTLQAQTAGRPSTWYHWAKMAICGVALIDGLDNFAGFLRRRLVAQKP